MAKLSSGAILQYICKGELPPPNMSTFQVMGTRKIAAPASSSDSESSMAKYRVSISDGNHRFSQAVMMLENDDQAPLDLTVISINVKNDKNSLKTISDKLILVIGDFKVCSLMI